MGVFRPRVQAPATHLQLATPAVHTVRWHPTAPPTTRAAWARGCRTARPSTQHPAPLTADSHENHCTTRNGSLHSASSTPHRQHPRQPLPNPKLTRLEHGVVERLAALLQRHALAPGGWGGCPGGAGGWRRGRMAPMPCIRPALQPPPPLAHHPDRWHPTPLPPLSSTGHSPITQAAARHGAAGAPGGRRSSGTRGARRRRCAARPAGTRGCRPARWGRRRGAWER